MLRFIGLSFFSINSTLRCFVYTSLQCRAIVAEKIVQRFDVVKVPRYSMLNVAVVVNYHSFEVSLSGVPNDDFLQNSLKILFRLSRVRLALEKCTLSGAIKFVSVR